MKKVKDLIFSSALSLSFIFCCASVIMSLYSNVILALGLIISIPLFISWYARTSNKFDAFGIGTYLLLIITVLMLFQPQSPTLLATSIHFEALKFLGAYTIFHFARMGYWTYKQYLFATKKEKKLLISNLIFTVILACIWFVGLINVELSSSTLIANSLLIAYIPVLTCTCVDMED